MIARCTEAVGLCRHLSGLTQAASFQRDFSDQLVQSKNFLLPKYLLLSLAVFSFIANVLENKRFLTCTRAHTHTHTHTQTLPNTHTHAHTQTLPNTRTHTPPPVTADLKGAGHRQTSGALGTRRPQGRWAQAHLRGAGHRQTSGALAGLVSDLGNEASVAVRRVTQIFWSPSAYKGYVYTLL